MKNYQRKGGWSKIIESKPFLIILGVLILAFAWNVLSFWNKMKDTSKNEKLAEEKVASLQQQKDKLSSDIANLNTDQGKEKVFREDFGLAKQGEDMIVIVENKDQPASPAKPTASSFFSSLFFWKNWFK